MKEHPLNNGSQSRICGAFAPVPTPVDSAGRLDIHSLTMHLKWLASEGLDGALVLGTNGEFPSFTLDERTQVAEAAAAAGSGLRLLLGVGSCSVSEVEILTDFAAELGYEAALCPPPFYFRAAPKKGVAAFFLQILDGARLPILLYHIPQVTGIAIDDELLDLLADHPMLAGVKDSSGSQDELLRLTDRFRERSYLVGNDRLVTRCLQKGGAGSISAAASVCPALVSSTMRNPELQEELDAVRGLLEEYGLGPAVKALLRSFGLGHYGSRPPMEGLESDAAEEFLERFRGLAKQGERPVDLNKT